MKWALIGTIVETVLLLAWIIVFQTQWQNWGTKGTNLLIWVPNTQWWTS